MTQKTNFRLQGYPKPAQKPKPFRLLSFCLTNKNNSDEQPWLDQNLAKYPNETWSFLVPVRVWPIWESACTYVYCILFIIYCSLQPSHIISIIMPMRMLRKKLSQQKEIEQQNNGWSTLLGVGSTLLHGSIQKSSCPNTCLFTWVRLAPSARKGPCLRHPHPKEMACTAPM